MERHGFVEGTTGITYVHKKDDRRHRKHCVHYRKDGSCAYMSRCGGSAHCQLYSETECKSEISVVTKDKINIITEENGKEAEFNIEMCIKNEILKWKN